jgi:hypothetical protein
MSGPHKAGDVIDKRYEVKFDIGEGGMQFVYAAHADRRRLLPGGSGIHR